MVVAHTADWSLKHNNELMWDSVVCMCVQLACAIFFLASNDVFCFLGKSDTGTEEHAYGATRPPAP